MIRQIGAALLLFAGLWTAPAHATGDISCSADGVSVDMLVGRLEVLGVLRAIVTVGEETWSTDQNVAQGTPIVVGQAFEDRTQLLVDFTDDNVSEIVGRLRAFAAEEGDNYASGGVFWLKGKGAWVVDCSLRG